MNVHFSYTYPALSNQNSQRYLILIACQNNKRTINLKRIQYQPVLFVFNLLQEAKIKLTEWESGTESRDLFGAYCIEIQKYFDVSNSFGQVRIAHLLRQLLLSRFPAIIAESRAAVEKSHAAVRKSHVAVRKSRVAVKESHVAVEKSRVAVRKSHVAVKKSHAAAKKSRVAVEESHAADEKKYRSLCVLLEVYKTGPKIPYSDYALYLFIGIVSVLCQLYFCKSNFLLYMIKLLVYDWNFYFNVFSSYFVSYRSLLCCITKSFLAWCPECWF